MFRMLLEQTGVYHALEQSKEYDGFIMTVDVYNALRDQLLKATLLDLADVLPEPQPMPQPVVEIGAQASTVSCMRTVHTQTFSAGVNTTEVRTVPTQTDTMDQPPPPDPVPEPPPTRPPVEHQNIGTSSTSEPTPSPWWEPLPARDLTTDRETNPNPPPASVQRSVTEGHAIPTPPPTGPPLKYHGDCHDGDLSSVCPLPDHMCPPAPPSQRNRRMDEQSGESDFRVFYERRLALCDMESDAPPPKRRTFVSRAAGVASSAGGQPSPSDAWPTPPPSSWGAASIAP